jgi:uncharacterized protein YbjT (DUF2867 family)
MATHYSTVIIFGPTGAVGRAAALEAYKRGAEVYLAMRDPSKPIPGITSTSDEDKYHRIQADLSDPESVKSAIQHSGAKAAYVYLIHSPGGTKPALSAMVEAGIEYIVVLSSFTIKKGVDVRSVQPEDLIPYTHAQGELALEELGVAHTALRPGNFASNPWNMSMDREKGDIYVFGKGQRVVDNIVPADIGRVAGSVLVDRPSQETKEIIYLYGPKLSGERETAEMIRKFWNGGEELKIVGQDAEGVAERMLKKGLPPPIVKYFVRVLGEGPDLGLYEQVFAEEGAANVTKYSGYEPTEFEEFAKGYDGE